MIVALIKFRKPEQNWARIPENPKLPARPLSLERQNHVTGMSTRCHIKILYMETTRLPVGALLKTIASVLWKRFCRTNYFGLTWDILSWQHKGLETRYHRPPHQVPNLNCCTCDFPFLSNKLEKQESNFALKLLLCQAREMNSHGQQLQLATWQVGANGW